MTSVVRHGQPRSSPANPTFRSRETSGFPGRGPRALQFSRSFQALCDLATDVGPPCWGSTLSAAAVHEFDGYPLTPPFHLVVMRGRFVNRIGHVIHTTTSLERIDRTTIEGLPVTSATRTIIDLAAFESRERLTAAIDSAFRDGRSSEDFLHRRLVALRSRGRRGISELLQVLAGIEVTKGGHSWLEREFLRLCAQSGLPLPDMQQVMGVRRNRLIRVDCHFPSTNLIVELLGYTFHRTVMQMQNDAERMNRLMLDGHRVLQFTYVDVVERAEASLAVVLEALT